MEEIKAKENKNETKERKWGKQKIDNFPLHYSFTSRSHVNPHMVVRKGQKT
jgi:hypothetical protein